MSITTEEYFPRGGRKPSTGTKRKSENISLFVEPATKKHKKQKSEEVNFESAIISTLNKSLGLTKYAIQEGTTVLACIKNVAQHALEIELPGFSTAKVTIDAISHKLIATLKNALKSSNLSDIENILKDMFKPGQFVPFKVRNVEVKDDKTTIFGSISPTEMNSSRRHDSFVRGELLWAVVSAELDHGFQIDCGVPNCRIFLPTQHIEESRELKIGQLIWCKVFKVENGKSASTLRVGAKKEQIESVFNDENASLSAISPGTKVEIFVDKILKHGIYGKFLDKFTGFIHESQLNPPLMKLNEIKEGDVVTAHVLYVEETTKITYLSMRSLESVYVKSYKRGDKLRAVVFGKHPSGMYLKLGDEMGWVSNRRLLHSLGNKTVDKNFNVIKKKFAVGSEHSCVVLSYSYMERMYICGFGKDLVGEKYFNLEDFTVGEVVQGVVHSVKSDGVVLSVGQVKAFIPNIHLMDVQFSEHLKKKFVIGKKLRAKVFKITDKSVLLTLKSKFLAHDDFFTSTDDVKINKVYPALVLKAKPFGLVLSFLNDVKGFIPTEEFGFQVTREYRTDPSSFFYYGEVINVRIAKIKQDKIIASLLLDTDVKKVLPVGTRLKGIVKTVEENGLVVFVPKMDVEGFLPINHLSFDVSLSKAMLAMFKENDKIPDLMVIRSNESGLTLSRREAIAYTKYNLKVPTFEVIEKDAILRCSIESIEDDGIYVSSPIKNFSKNIFVQKMFISDEANLSNFDIHTSVLGKVIDINQMDKTISLNLRPKDVVGNSIQKSIDYFSLYLMDENRLRKMGMQNKLAINQYNLAERLDCIVKKVSKTGCLVELPNGSHGLVVASLSGSPKVGDRVEGVVLGHNYYNNYVELCLDRTIADKINPVQGGRLHDKMEERFTAEKLLTRGNHILALLRNRGNRQFVYLPLRLCEHDLQNSLESYYECNTFKVEIVRQSQNRLIAYHKFILQAYARMKIIPSVVRKMKIIEKANKSEDPKNNKLVDNNKSNSLVSLPSTNSEIKMIGKVSNKKKVKKNQELVEDNSNLRVSTKETDFSSSEENDSELEEEIKMVCDEKENADVETPSDKRVKIRKSSSGSSNKKTIDKIKRQAKQMHVLPSISSFFDLKNDQDMKESSDSELDDVDEKIIKKKLSATEKMEAAKLEEERLSKIEKELADSTSEPQSVEQFERMLLAEPNSSTMWIKYMSHYLSLAEFEKARAVGRKALETINMTQEAEKFNVWISLLNLENLYGTKESFDQLFEEAVRHADAFQIYKRVVDILYESGKFMEVEEKIRKMRGKFKHEPEMWTYVAKIYYLMNRLEEARNMMNPCLLSITNPKLQFNLIIKFAILEHEYGDLEVGCSIFELVINTYPNKVNAWLVYVDQLIKKERIAEARNVLKRAINMKLSLKASKGIYHKFKAFEEKYGTQETLSEFNKTVALILQEKTKL